jgi:hypothetical protein
VASRADQADKKTMGDAEQALEECVLLEAELAELRAKYEQFFLGVDRMPPSKMHDALKRRVLGLKGLFLRQTAVKFRVQALAAKLTTFERLWDRTLKEIEAGTYRRDLFKAKLHQQKRKQPAGEKAEASDDFHVDEDLDLSDLDDNDDDLEAVIAQATEAVSQKAPTPAGPPVVQRPVVTPAPPIKQVLAGAPLPNIKPVLPNASPPVKPVVTPALPPLPAIAPPRPNAAPATQPRAAAAAPAAGTASGANAGAAGGLSEQKIKAIFEAYVMAKKRCGEDTRALTLDSVSSSLKKQVPELMKQHNAKSVEFKVVIKDGKAVLRALPKDS